MMEKDKCTKEAKEMFYLERSGEKYDKMVVTEWATKRNGEGIRPGRRRGNKTIRNGRRKDREE
jgi:hypothetical protein